MILLHVRPLTSQSSIKAANLKVQQLPPPQRIMVICFAIVQVIAKIECRGDQRSSAFHCLILFFAFWG